jgi:hypothetical protein
MVLLTSAALGATSALASSDCKQACSDEYDAAQQVCEETYYRALADLDAMEAQCYALPPTQERRCLKGVKDARTLAKREYKDCLAIARTANQQCKKDCSASPCAPAS